MSRRVAAATALALATALFYAISNVLELLAEQRRGLTVSEIAAGMGLSLPEIFRVIVVMERRGWLQKSDGDKYSVTPHVLHLAFRATSAEE